MYSSRSLCPCGRPRVCSRRGNQGFLPTWTAAAGAFAFCAFTSSTRSWKFSARRSWFSRFSRRSAAGSDRIRALRLAAVRQYLRLDFTAPNFSRTARSRCSAAVARLSAAPTASSRSSTASRIASLAAMPARRCTVAARAARHAAWRRIVIRSAVRARAVSARAVVTISFFSTITLSFPASATLSSISKSREPHGARAQKDRGRGGGGTIATTTRACRVAE